MSKVHIGKKIREVWKASRMKGTEFASLINRDRQVIYDIFKRESIDTDLLQQISKVLNHDFFSYYNTATIAKEPKDKFGYATKDDITYVYKLIEKLSKAVEDIQLRLPAKRKAVKKEYSREKKGAGCK